MPSTLTWGITYPSGSQAPNVPVVMQTLAESVDSAITAATTQTVAALSLDTSLYTAYSGYETPKYRKSRDGQVMLGGGVGIKTGLSGDQIIFSAATQYTIATLPVGVRPAAKRIFDPVVSFAMETQAKWKIDILPDGTVKLEHNSGTAVTVSRTNFLLGLDNMQFWIG